LSIENSGGWQTIPSLRWWIGGILFASTVINYIDRQTLSLLAPYLKQDFHWTNTDYANIGVAFRVAYSIGMTACGRLIDRVGTKRGLTMTVLGYSIASMLTPLARGFYSFMGFRFLLGAGESGNWPGATKAVSEWFPKTERGLAAAFFDSGSSIAGDLFPVGISGGVRGAGAAWARVVGGVEMVVLLARGASEDFGWREVFDTCGYVGRRSGR
jgi:ACS family hexuronate transporter-like MFS transporter